MQFSYCGKKIRVSKALKYFISGVSTEIFEFLRKIDFTKNQYAGNSKEEWIEREYKNNKKLLNIQVRRFT